MEFDRGRFLMLAAALSASACGDSNSPGGSGGVAETNDAGVCDDTSGPSSATSYNTCTAEIGGTDSCFASLQQFCWASAEGLKPKEAAFVVACSVAYDCSTGGVYPYHCAQEALAAACPDSTADATCVVITQHLAGTPSAMTAAACHAVVDGMTAKGRDYVQSCVEGHQGEPGYDAWGCAEGYLVSQPM